MKEAHVESDGQGNYYIRDGRNLQNVIPVVVIGQVDPDERTASEHGTGINLDLPVDDAVTRTILAAIEAINTGIQTDTTKIKRFGYMSVHPTMGPVDPASTADAQDAQQRIGFAEATLVGGALANLVLVPAVAGKTGFVRPFAVWSDSADTYIFAFENADDIDLQPFATPVDVDIKHDDEVAPFGGTHGAAGDNSGGPGHSVIYRSPTDNNALEVDILGGAGAEHVVIWFIYHYE
jgi:hypothetical protein